MGLLKAFWGRNSTYVLGIVVTAFVIDRTIEISSEQLWKYSNKNVSFSKKNPFDITA